MNAAILLLCLTPTPRDRAFGGDSPADQIMGYWTVRWGETLIQGCYFLNDGTYCSPEFGGGPWFSDGNSSVTFLERTTWWLLVIEECNGNEVRGYVRSFDCNWNLNRGVTLLHMRRGERLKVMPQEVK